MKAEYTNPYKQLQAIGAEMDHHESDLYVLATPEVMAVIRASGWSWSHFRSNIDGKLWVDLPFAYEPFWTAKLASQA